MRECIDPRIEGIGQRTWCGKPSVAGYDYCVPCTTYFEKRYPQGWRYYAGDVCMHGTYVGGCGIDWMCGGCEDGYTNLTDCSVDTCDYQEFTRHDEPMFIEHVENPTRSRVAKEIMDLRRDLSLHGISVSSPKAHDVFHQYIAVSRGSQQRWIHQATPVINVTLA